MKSTSDWVLIECVSITDLQCKLEYPDIAGKGIFC